MNLLRRPHRVVLVRHGESVWNKENRYTGWQNVALSPQGVQESLDAGRRIAAAGLSFDVAFTSVLRRSICCFNHIADVLDLHHIPIHKTYRLNERHYGALEGLNKAEMIAKHGAKQVEQWTRSFEVRPPAQEVGVLQAPEVRSLYPQLLPDNVPLTEVVPNATL